MKFKTVFVSILDVEKAVVIVYRTAISEDLITPFLCTLIIVIIHVKDAIAIPTKTAQIKFGIFLA